MRRGKAIDGLYNVIAYAIEGAEKHLLEQENFAEIQKKLKKEKIRAERESLLLEQTPELPNIIGLEDLNEETFSHLLESYKTAKIRKIEAEKKAAQEAEEKRKKEEQDRKELEMRALEAEKKLAEERKKAEVEEKKRKAEREKMEAEREEERRKSEEEREKAEKAREVERKKMEEEMRKSVS